VNGAHVILRQSYTITQAHDHWEDRLIIGDAVVKTPHFLKLVTPWIKLRNMQDLGRLWRASFLARCLSTFEEDEDGLVDANSLLVEVGYDYETEYSDTLIFTAFDNDDGYGSLAPPDRGVRNADTPRFSIGPSRQLCSAVRFRIQDFYELPFDEFHSGRGYEIPAIDLEVGMLPGSNKLLPAKRQQ
jgi:hypothetical protein